MTEKIRVNFKAFDSVQLDKAVKEIVSIVKRPTLLARFPCRPRDSRFVFFALPMWTKRAGNNLN